VEFKCFMGKVEFDISFMQVSDHVVL
jgi:hypothetical protein